MLIGSVKRFDVGNITYYVDRNTANLKYCNERSAEKITYKNSNGVILKSKDESGYYDANGKKISEKEWNKLELTAS